MKIILGLSLTVSFLTALPLAFAGNGSHGGDVVNCKEKGARGQDIRRMRVLDSVLMDGDNAFEIIRRSNYQVTKDKMIEHLKKNFPLFGSDLEVFWKTFLKKGDLKNGVFWISGIPKDIQDENVFVELPSNCEDEYIQAVHRLKRNHDNATRFYYNPTILSDLEKNGDELSWIVIHEWLRKFTADAERIRIINGYLHSKNFLTANDDDIYIFFSHFFKGNYLSFSIPEKYFFPSASHPVIKEELKNVKIKMSEFIEVRKKILSKLTVDPTKLKRSERKPFVQSLDDLYQSYETIMDEVLYKKFNITFSNDDLIDTDIKMIILELGPYLPAEIVKEYEQFKNNYENGDIYWKIQAFKTKYKLHYL